MNHISLEDYFAVALVTKSTITRSSPSGLLQPDKPDLFEERIFMVKALNEDEAIQKLLDRIELPLSYDNTFGEEVTWALECVKVLSPLIVNNLTEVTEVCGRYFRDIAMLHSLFYDYSEE